MAFSQIYYTFLRKEVCTRFSSSSRVILNYGKHNASSSWSPSKCATQWAYRNRNGGSSVLNYKFSPLRFNTLAASSVTKDVSGMSLIGRNNIRTMHSSTIDCTSSEAKPAVGGTSQSSQTAKGESKDTTEDASPSPPKKELSKKEKLKQAVRDYGATVIVFHVTMSLASLGICYLMVQSGLDVVSIMAKIGISESVLQSKVTEEAGKFVVAYAVHKVFAPVRITITLTATPFIVRKLRSMGILKQIKSKAQ